MEAKVYVTMFCDIVKQEVFISYRVFYKKISPILGENKCEHHKKECDFCPKKELRNEITSVHFEDEFKNLSLLIVLDNDDTEEITG